MFWALLDENNYCYLTVNNEQPAPPNGRVIVITGLEEADVIGHTLSINGEWIAPAPTPKAETEEQKEIKRLKAQVSMLSETLEMYEECIVEMAEIVYA